MRLTYRRVIELHLNREETKLWEANNSYRCDVIDSARDQARDSGWPVEIWLSVYRNKANASAPVFCIAADGGFNANGDPLQAVY